jgi:hypothetical protein
VQFAVGFKIQGKTGHVVVDAEDALIAALKVKMQRPEALIAYMGIWRRCSPLWIITEHGDGPRNFCGTRLNLLIGLLTKTLIHSLRLFAARVAAPPAIRDKQMGASVAVCHPMQGPRDAAKVFHDGNRRR